MKHIKNDFKTIVISVRCVFACKYYQCRNLWVSKHELWHFACDMSYVLCFLFIAKAKKGYIFATVDWILVCRMLSKPCVIAKENKMFLILDWCCQTFSVLLAALPVLLRHCFCFALASVQMVTQHIWPCPRLVGFLIFERTQNTLSFRKIQN